MCAICRKIDDLGRVILPIEMRTTLKFAKNQPIEISLEGEKIILRKTSMSCYLCGGEEQLSSKGKYLLCNNCFFEICNG
ncbi:MAG: AbrB/MazE/SpoVT family DNA-binding domain-containing protein [Oscillospiraceae bacterium]